MKLRIDRSETLTIYAVEQDGKLTDLQVWESDDEDPRYQLHVARVKKVLPAVNGSILDLGDREAYLSWADLDPARKERGKTIAACVDVEERLLVQIRRAESGDKADKATLRIALPGAFMVYLPNEVGISISTKIRNPETRAGLESSLACLDGSGVILRTLAAEASGEQVENELAGLIRAYESVVEKAKKTKSLRSFLVEVDSEPTFFSRWLKQADQLISNDPEDQSWAKRWNIDFAQSENPLGPCWQDWSGLRKRAVSISDQQGEILLEELETLTAIDVNRRGSAKASIATIDTLAVREAMRQLRLRNIGGMVVIDVIDKRKANRSTREVTAARINDSHPIKVYGPSGMGLIELIRTKRGASIKQLLGSYDAPTALYALWRFRLALRQVACSSGVRIQGNPGLINQLRRENSWETWVKPSGWKQVVWESLDQEEEFLRILPILKKTRV
jgi:Ribonuclease G/E